MRLKGEKRALDEKNFLLQKENADLRDRIHRLHNDNLYLERIAREELNLVRPGEIVYRFAQTVGSKDKPASIAHPRKAESAAERGAPR
jgi:hypothetical protein